jgi:hypothetical protein
VIAISAVKAFPVLVIGSLEVYDAQIARECWPLLAVVHVAFLPGEEKMPHTLRPHSAARSPQTVKLFVSLRAPIMNDEFRRTSRLISHIRPVVMGAQQLILQAFISTCGTFVALRNFGFYEQAGMRVQSLTCLSQNC